MPLIQQSKQFVKVVLKRLIPWLGHRLVPCNLCGARDADLLLEKQGFPVVKCRRCKLVYAGRQPTHEELLARYSPTYFQNEYRPWLEANEATTRAHYLGVIQETAVYAPAATPFRLAEFGCGAGLLLHTARQELGWEVYGNEINPDGVAYAHQRYGLKDQVKHGDIYRVKYPSRYFHAVVVADVIEHVDNPRRLLRLANRSLVMGGAIFLSTPNIESRSFLEQGFHWRELSPPEHIYYFSPETLSRMLEQCGFECRRVWMSEGGEDCLFCVATKSKKA